MLPKQEYGDSNVTCKNVIIIVIATVNLLFGLMVAHFQGGVIVNKRSLQIIHSDSVDPALFAV